MRKSHFKVAILTYIVMFTFIFIFNMATKIKAEDNRKYNDKIYHLEMNDFDLSEIKEDILKKDVKYLVFPKLLKHDVEISEVDQNRIDLKSFEVQNIDLDVYRYLDSKSGKIKKDFVSGSVKVQFVDTTPPTISLKNSQITIDEGSKFNANDYLVEVSDNSFNEVTLNIDNPVNVNKAGTYTVVYTAVDSSNNESSKELSVTVKAKPVVVVYRAPQVSVSSAVASSSDVITTLNLINQYRANAGLYALQLGSATHQQAVQVRANEARGYVSHTRPDGRSYKSAFTDLGLYNQNVIEVLTYSGSRPIDKVNWWMSSPVHRRVLMRSDITHIAIGISGKMYAGIVYR